MSETAKIPKSAVLYIHKKDTNYRCRQCAFAKAGANRCALYGPSEMISPMGTCGMWVVKKGQSELPFIGGVNKTQTGYVEEREGYSCLRCDEFLSQEKDCKKVDKNSPGDDEGQIVAEACCSRWEKLKEQ